MTKLRVILGSAVAIFALVVAANAGAFSGDDEKRNCGAGVRPRTVAAIATFQGGYIEVHGFIGPAKFGGPGQVRKNPFKFTAQACPGETASITALAIRPPLPTLRVDITVGGGTLTGNSIERSGTAGARSVATAVIT